MIDALFGRKDGIRVGKTTDILGGLTNGVIVEGDTDSAVDGAIDDGLIDGTTDESIEGLVDGYIDGTIEGSVNGLLVVPQDGF